MPSNYPFTEAVANSSSTSHAVNHVQKNMHKSISFFALDEPDVSFEVGDRGVYTGKEALTTLFADQYGSAVLKGNLLIQLLTTGSVQVAGDGKTAKGIWRGLIVEAVMPKDGGGDPVPIWACGAYAGEPSTRATLHTLNTPDLCAVDFIKKGSEWKIWHPHWFRTIKVLKS